MFNCKTIDEPKAISLLSQMNFLAKNIIGRKNSKGQSLDLLLKKQLEILKFWNQEKNSLEILIKFAKEKNLFEIHQMLNYLQKDVKVSN